MSGPSEGHAPGTPLSEANARAREAEVFERQAKQLGRLDVALAVKAHLRGVMLTKEIPGARQPTPEEKAVWELVEGFAQRMGATVEGQ